jgi:diguanylate cyclase (GGDEF)-like protein/PAS domain S-box-containing protein
MSIETCDSGETCFLANEEFCPLLPAGNTLQDNVHFIHKFLDTIPFPVFVRNSMSAYIACNQAFEDYLGVRREQVLGKTARECGHEGLDGAGYESATDPLSCNGTHTYETTIVSSDGSLRDIICSRSGYLNSDGAMGGIIGSIFDITGHKHTKGLLDNIKFLQILIDTIPCPIFYKDKNGTYLGCNTAFEEYMNTPRKEIIGKSDYDFVPKEVADKYCRADLDLLQKKGIQTYEASIQYPDGTRHEVICNKAVFPNPEGDPGGLVGSILDITDRKKIEEQLMYQANHDSLTGLPNRNLLNDRLCNALAYEDRHRELLAVMLIDLDNFKVVNDTMGHSSGDLLLLEAAKRLQDCVRQYDTVARLGGDEFVLLLRDVEHIRALAGISDKILALFKEPFFINNHEVFVTASIGIATYPADGVTADALLKNADTAMYHAKELGRNGYQFYAEEMNVKVQERLNMETRLRKALERQEFFLLYQPRVDVASGLIAGAEALLRWLPEGEEIVMPNDFIPLLEETGLIVQVGEWVLREVCLQGMAWLSAGAPPLIVSVNVSARQFHQKNLPERVEEILRETGFPPHLLEIELTESIIIQDVEETILKLNRLKKMGVRLSIDDFGTGYSSLNYLKRFPIDILKIDKSFVNGLTTDPDDATIVSTIIAMAHNLKMNVVAEGVETGKQLQFVDQQGCEEVQGFYFSIPLPAESVSELILNRQQLQVGDYVE